MANKFARVCFASTNPTSEGLEEADVLRLAISENPRNASLTIPIGPDPIPAPERPLGLAMTTARFWKPGTTLRVRFLAGSDWQKQKVRSIAPLWCNYGNIKLEFIDEGKCDILIDFNPRLGSWSFIGVTSRQYASQNKASMNLGWIVEDQDESELSSVILHEFGHALGAIHEHESPYANIPWNKEAVYKYYAGPPNYWNRTKVDHNMFSHEGLDTIQATAFDPLSIMLYYYPPEFTTDGRGTSENSTLSALDQKYIRFCYPEDTVDAGQFNTIELRSWSDPQQRNNTLKYLQTTYSTPPKIAVGLTWLDIDRKAHYRISATATNITTTTFTGGLNAWADTVLYAAGMTYLEIGPSLSYIQTGTFDTADVYAGNVAPSANSKRINFSRPFPDGARVVCWINKLDFDCQHNCRIRVFPSDIDSKGFTANIKTWADSIMYGASMTWIAYPSNQPSVASGRVSTTDIRPSNQPRTENSGTGGLGNAFSKPPKLIVALDTLDFDYSQNLRIRSSVSSVTRTQFVWHLQSTWNSIMYEAGASWFAWT